MCHALCMHVQILDFITIVMTFSKLIFQARQYSNVLKLPQSMLKYMTVFLVKSNGGETQTFRDDNENCIQLNNKHKRLQLYITYITFHNSINLLNSFHIIRYTEKEAETVSKLNSTCILHDLHPQRIIDCMSVEKETNIGFYLICSDNIVNGVQQIVNIRGA